MYLDRMDRPVSTLALEGAVGNAPSAAYLEAYSPGGLSGVVAAATGVLSLGKWIAGAWPWGSRPLTERGKHFENMARARGVEKNAARGWAREWEKKMKGGLSQAQYEAMLDTLVSDLPPPLPNPYDLGELRRTMKHFISQAYVFPWQRVSMPPLPPILEPEEGGPVPVETPPGAGPPAGGVLRAGFGGPAMILMGLVAVGFLFKGRR